MIPRTKIPNAGNKLYNTKDAGGVSPCIKGNLPKGSKNRTGIKGLSVLPNCVGYATGRFNEIAGENAMKWLGNTNANNFINLAIKQGLKWGKTPLLGGCMVWDDGTAGHVAIVETIVNDKTVLTSESEWNGLPFATYKRQYDDGNWRKGCTWMQAKKCYKYLGCVYQPEEQMTKEDFKKMFFEMCEDLKKENPSKWAESYIDKAKSLGITDGTAPKAYATREETIKMIITAKDK